MANGLFDYGRNLFARGEINWKQSGGSTIRAFMIDLTYYTADLANHQFLSDIPVTARKGNSGGSARADAPQLVLQNPVRGVCDALDIVFTGLPAGIILGAVLLFKDGGSDNASPLIFWQDTTTGIPLTTNGADITGEWSNGPNKIFKL